MFNRVLNTYLQPLFLLKSERESNIYDCFEVQHLFQGKKNVNLLEKPTDSSKFVKDLTVGSIYIFWIQFFFFKFVANFIFSYKPSIFQRGRYFCRPQVEAVHKKPMQNKVYKKKKKKKRKFSVRIRSIKLPVSKFQVIAPLLQILEQVTCSFAHNFQFIVNGKPLKGLNFFIVQSTTMVIKL